MKNAYKSCVLLFRDSLASKVEFVEQKTGTYLKQLFFSFLFHLLFAFVLLALLTSLPFQLLPNLISFLVSFSGDF